MAPIGSRRASTELRKNPRRQFHYQARILTSETGTPSACAIADISQCGARIILAEDEELPRSFLLLLTSEGSARRACRLVWRDGLTVGVEFPQRDP